MKQRNNYIEPWGKLRGGNHNAQEINWATQPFPMPENQKTTLAFGVGRSYGDSCVNPDNNICLTNNLNRFHHFDPKTGSLTCGGGVTLDQIMRVFVPKGWFPAVVPGTKFVTVAGAIANDIHGKNHHMAGTWGNHVTQINLIRSDHNDPIQCSLTENPEMFSATIGGLGLTGIITHATIQLVPIKSGSVQVEYTPFSRLEEFFELSNQSTEWDHTVAWIDLTCQTGRGVFMQGKFMDNNENEAIPEIKPHHNPKIKLPFNLPGWAVNKLSIKAFNTLYRSAFRKPKKEICHYDPFFFPLDKIHQWNKVYGKRGFFQYQSVIPGKNTAEPTLAMLKEIVASGNGSPLAVLKNFGNQTSPGLLSFPMEGTTMAMDFTNTGWETLEMMNRLDNIVNTAKGRLYPAKDIRMKSEDFQRQYPNWKTLEEKRDPKLLSQFWKRVTPTATSL